MRRLMFIAPFLIFGTLAVYFAFGLGRDPHAIPSVLIDRPAPAFTLPPISGEGPGLSLETLRGAPAVLNIFASWCVPCREEHPLLMRLAKEENVAVWGINYKDKPEAALAWLAEHGNPYRGIGADRAGRVAIDFGVYGVPETFILDASGRIRFKQVGPLTPEIITTTLLPLIRRLSSPP